MLSQYERSARLEELKGSDIASQGQKILVPPGVHFLTFAVRTNAS